MSEDVLRADSRSSGRGGRPLRAIPLRGLERCSAMLQAGCRYGARPTGAALGEHLHNVFFVFFLLFLFFFLL